ncbi:MAG TPA: ABC-F family ATP-binding cassette domain-containing protein, partial [Candidatus Polarisedimenticolia bacterium]|nr:ABC-F family ATP-binding cassette domain-containing protein [Candidatus Polarisedimenticolia bacterium]
SGTRTQRKNIRIGYVPQTPVFAPGRTAEEIVTEAVATDQRLDDHERRRCVMLALAKTGFTNHGVSTDLLSGGWRARLAIAREIAGAPDLLLLDEPTNHLDIDSILWLEALLRNESNAFVVVSHDRYFLERVALRMLEINRLHDSGLFQVTGTYADFLEARDAALSNQAAYRDTLAGLVRREVAWLRRGAKARTTKSKARIQTAERSIEMLQEARSREAVPTLEIEFASSGRRTKRLWCGEGIRIAFDGTTIIDSLDLVLTPGVRCGVLGPNGSGKTSLLRTIVGEIAPAAGTIQRAEGLRVVYFDQHREALDPSLTLKRALAPEGDSVIYRDRVLHVASWAKRFLFQPGQLEAQVSRLSGGERARIILARMMLQPADLLVLDEPTNDLDIPALEVLEEALLDFPGALVLVSHDRLLLDRVSTQVIALDGSGGAQHFADYGQWEANRPAQRLPKKEAPRPPTAKTPQSGARRLSYLEQREWDGMEAAVVDAEARLAEARGRAEDPSIATDAIMLQKRLSELDEIQARVDQLYARWAALDEKRK